MTTLVYRYGLLAPTSGGDEVREQMRLGCRYRNELTAIERGRRSAARALMAAQPDVGRLEAAVAEAEAGVVAALGALKAQRAKTRSASDTAEHRDDVKAAKERKKGAVAALREQRRAVRENGAIIAASKALWAKAAELTRSARAHNGLHWGTGALVDEAMKAASKAPLYDGAEPNDPKFLRFDGTGHVGVQVHQKGAGLVGLTVDEVLSCAGNAGQWLAIARIAAPEAKPARTPGIARHRAMNAARHADAVVNGGGSAAEHAELRMRIGTAEDGAPIMPNWPMIVHRPLPPSAVVKRIAVSLRRIGPREEWSAEFTISLNDVARLARQPTSQDPIDTSACERPAPTGDGTVAVELGWLALAGGLRVASTLDDTGEADALMLSNVPTGGRRTGGDKGHGMIGGMRRAESLRSTRDKNFNAARATLVAWLRANGMPKWMRALTVRRGAEEPSEAQALAYLAQWRSPGRLASLARRWRENRYDGDAMGVDAIEAWRYHDHHLWAWESSQRTTSLRSRKDLYRCFAVKLARRYARVVVSDVDLHQIAKTPEVELVNEHAASNRQLAAVSELRLALKQACAKYGAEYVEVKAVGLSSTCPACNAEVVATDAGTHELDCLKCSYRNHDLDTTALLNALRRAGCGDAVDRMIKRGKQIGAAFRAA